MDILQFCHGTFDNWIYEVSLLSPWKGQFPKTDYLPQANWWKKKAITVFQSPSIFSSYHHLIQKAARDKAIAVKWWCSCKKCRRSKNWKNFKVNNSNSAWLFTFLSFPVRHALSDLILKRKSFVANIHWQKLLTFYWFHPFILYFWSIILHIKKSITLEVNMQINKHFYFGFRGFRVLTHYWIHFGAFRISRSMNAKMLKMSGNKRTWSLFLKSEMFLFLWLDFRYNPFNPF